MHVLNTQNDHVKAKLIRVLIVMAFLLAQFWGLVHAYEHHEDEHAQHQCDICLIQAHSDDLVAESKISVQLAVIDPRLVLLQVASVQVGRLHSSQSRAPPVFSTLF